MDVYQRRRLVALSVIAGVFILIVVVIASAGGDDEPDAPAITTVGTTPETATTPKSDYIDEADAICAEVNSALASVDTSDAAAAAAEELELLSGELDQLQSLPPPDEDEDQANDFLRALQNQVTALEDREVAVDRGDDAALVEIDERLSTLEAEAQDAAERFGFEVCGNPEGGAETSTEPGTDTGAVPAPTEPAAPVEPAPTEPAVPVEPAPTEPPADGGGGGGGGTGGVSP
jgi:hypothetical protein